MQIYRGEKVIAYGYGVAAEGHRRSLDRIRVMQRPELRTTVRCGSGGARAAEKVREEEEEIGRNGQAYL